jgi:hypothetical protein
MVPLLQSVWLLVGPSLPYVRWFPLVNSSNQPIPGCISPSFCRIIFLSCLAFGTYSLLEIRDYVRGLILPSSTSKIACPASTDTVFSSRRQKDGATEKWFHCCNRYGYWLDHACRTYAGFLWLIPQTSPFQAALVHLSVASFFCPVLHLRHNRYWKQAITPGA